MEDRTRDVTPVAIIGGGWAGCAAAVELAAAGVPSVLFEAAPVLGGRARRVVRDGLPLDNGQHLLLGAYRQTLGMLARVCGEPDTRARFVRSPLAIAPFDRDMPGALSLRARRAPGRLGLLTGLLLARGLSWKERWANLAWFRALEQSGFARPASETVARMLKPLPPRVARFIWEPLCLAALNTPIATASAQIFANVLRAAFAGAGDASDFLVPATDLSAVFPEAAARYATRRGARVRLQSPAEIVSTGRQGVTLGVHGDAIAARAAIVAVGPHQLRQAFSPEALAGHPPLPAAIDALEALAYEPIATIWLGYASATRMPAPMARLDDAPGQWVIDRPDILARAEGTLNPAPAQMLSVVVSASGAHTALTHDALARAADAQLRRLRPALPACMWSQVITEKRATYACTPARPRPAGVRIAPGVYLAGDYVDAEYPATLEAAVKSGIAAAAAVMADCR